MTTNTPLLVPVNLHALVVNEEVRKRQNFQRYDLDYANLKKFSSPEPNPYAGNSNDFNQHQKNDGVYLHWSLPDCLRQGNQDNQQAKTSFPLIPNRWLVVRYSGPLNARISTAWIIESDYLDANNGTVSFLNPADKTLQSTRLGRKLLVSGDPWTEPGNATFLTAMGPGNPIFLTYQPDNENVVSIHDPLGDVSDNETLSYCVLGWYSKPGDDILASWGASANFKERLTQLGWEFSGNSSFVAHNTVYQSLINGIVWEKNGSLPSSEKPEPEAIEVAIGNTQIDALTALIEKQEKDSGVSVNAKLLEVFQYDLLSILDQQDGDIEVENAMTDAWFGSLPGGYHWDIAYTPNDSPAKGGEPINEKECLKEEAWLVELNRNQKAYDEGYRELLALQVELYNVWWKNGNADRLPKYPDGVTPKQFSESLDPKNSSSLAYKVQSQCNKTNKLLAKLPYGETAEDLETSINAYEAVQKLPANRNLRRSNLQDFRQPNDPTLLFSGVKTKGLLVAINPIVCRAPDQEITGFKYNDKGNEIIINVQSMKGKIPLPETSGMPDVLPSLVNEFFLLDATNATMIAKVVLDTSDPEIITKIATAQNEVTNSIGTRPDPEIVTTMAWIGQPWKPLMMMWMIDYYPIPYLNENGCANWVFDGNEWQWLGDGAVMTPLTLSGRVFLTPKSAFNMRSLLEKYLKNTPNPDVQALEDFITRTDDWDFLSQSMDGLGAQILMQSPLSNRALNPSEALGEICGGNTFYSPAPGLAKKPAMGPWPPSNYQETRSAQFAFERLTIVDRFGQTVEKVISQTAESFIPVLSHDLRPGKPVMPLDPSRFIQLQPRLNMPGRLNFNFVSAKHSEEIISDKVANNPVCAWVLPNHLDKALTFYGPLGEALGEMRVITNDQQKQIVHWDRAPYSQYTKIKQLEKEFPHLYGVLSALVTKGSEAFNQFLHVIDTTLWSIDPLGNRDDLNLSVLVGRPLALLRTKLEFALDGPASRNQSWRFTFDPKAPEFLNWPFPVRLGELNNHGDGLLGYFIGTNYEQFFSTHTELKLPQSDTSSYITPIAPDNYPKLLFNNTSSVFLTMLADPRATIHASTGILPTMKVSVPSEFVDLALSAMDVTFRTGPVLTNPLISIEGDDTSTRYHIPKPSERHGEWSWLEFEPQKKEWESFGLAPTDPGAKLTNTPLSLRSGLMRLSKALNITRNSST